MTQHSNDFVSRLISRFGDPFDKGAPRFEEWVTRLTLDGHPFTWRYHEYLRQPYGDDHPFIVEQKAAQLGLTSKAIIKVAYLARFQNYRGILYLFPSKTDVTEFSKGRVSPLIDDNPDTIGSWISETDAANIKRIHNAFLYLRGMQSRISLKSIPVDFIVFDELDEAPQQNITMAMQRMAHSEFKHVMMLSNPTLPDFGINKEFKLTDQNYWMLKCPKCNSYTCMEDTFPKCLEERSNGDVVRLCQACRDATLNPDVGEWVAKYPKVKEKRGYHYSQLFSHYVTPKEIIDQYRTTTNMQDFQNLVVGNEYVEATHRLSIQQVLALCQDYKMSDSEETPCFMGVDQGGVHHAVISKPDPTKKLKAQIVKVGRFKDWQDIAFLMKAYRISRCVVDALPETRDARALADAFPGRVWLCYYSETQKGAYAWDETNKTVTVNRTESLDASHQEISNMQISLPRQDIEVYLFAKHCNNMAKRLEMPDENEKTKQPRYVYVSLGSGEDHYRHAFNYEAIARQTGPRWLFPEAQ